MCSTVSNRSCTHSHLQAYKRGYWYPRYHFLLLGWYSPEWWKDVQSNCTVAQLELALQHSLTVDLLPDARVLGDDWEATDLGIVSMLYLFALGMYVECSVYKVVNGLEFGESLEVLGCIVPVVGSLQT